MNPLPIADLGKVVRLSREERRLLAKSLILLPLTAMGLRILGCRRWHGLLVAAPRSRRRRQRMTDPERSDRLQIVSRMVKAAAVRVPWQVTCLERSLVLWWFFHRHGIESEIRFGVRKEGGRFEAHAWIEHAGGTLDVSQDGEQRFAPFDKPLTGI